MNLGDHLPLLCVLLPAATAVLLLAIGDGGAGAAGGRGSARLDWSRRIALASVLLGAVFSWLLIEQAATGSLAVVHLGSWPAPFGIVLVVDRLSAMMLALTSVIAVPVLLYASGGWDSHGRHFHALFQFQLMGLNGAFVTGDLFNLFVFFEVLLVASYALLLHGLGRDRLRAGVHYVVLNLAASALFLVGAALVYGATGTLNLAQLALVVPQALGTQATLLQVAAVLLLVVFGLKAALVPLGLWLPATYAAACAPVAALFAIMTKVGVYAILRVHGVVFGTPDPGAVFDLNDVLLAAGLATAALAVCGVLAAHTLSRLAAWLTMGSVGTIVAALGLAGAPAWSGALYYLLNSTLVIAALFLLAELVAAQRGTAGDRLEPAGAVAQPVLLGLMLLLAAASTAGLPPLPGFIGKLMILQASAPHAWALPVWATLLGVGLLTLVALARAGSILFWHVRADSTGGRSGASVRLTTATVALLSGSVFMSALAGPVQRYTAAAAAQLSQREAYARAVLTPPGARAGPAPNTTLRPYTGGTP
ncbi:MAG: monovalent cation/H+ antiporter subunit D [Rubrivivax sp.]